VTAKGLEFAFGSVLDMWRFQQLETYDGHEQGCRVFKSFPTAGKRRAHIYEIPPISPSASGFGPHLIIEWRLGYDTIPRTTEACCQPGRGNDKSRRD
jgi:hypothetical protein